MIKGLPEKLRTLRKQYGFSQREAASRLGISTSVISAYENGERTPSTENLLALSYLYKCSTENLLALSYLYKCSTDYLLGRETDPPKAVLDTDGLSAKQIQLLSELIETMS